MFRWEKGYRVNVVKAYGKTEDLADYRVHWLAKIVYSSAFELFIGFVILVNAISLAVLTMPDVSDAARSTSLRIDEIAFNIYLVELALRIISYGRRPDQFFRQPWNIFDFVVVGLSPFLQGHTVVLRLLRLLRLVRIFRFLPEVRILTTSIVRSLPPLLSMGVLISLLLFLYGMAGHYMFGDALPESWGSITVAMTTLFILLTLENFPNYLEAAIEVNEFALPFFLSYVFVIVFTVLNVLIGIVLHAMDQAREEYQARELLQLDSIADEVEEISLDGEITAEEVEKLKLEIKRLRTVIGRLADPDANQ